MPRGKCNRWIKVNFYWANNRQESDFCAAMRSIYMPQLAWYTGGTRAESKIDSQPLSPHCVDYLMLFPNAFNFPSHSH